MRLDVQGYFLSMVCAGVFAAGWYTRRWWGNPVHRFLDRIRVWQIAGVAMATRCAVLVCCDLTQFSDYADFHDIAVRLAETGVWWDPGRPPGISWLAAGCYAITGVHTEGPLLVNLALSMASLYVVWRVAHTMFGAATGRVAALSLALYPEHIIHVNYICSEPGYFLGVNAAALLYAKAVGHAEREQQKKEAGCAAGAGLALGVAHYFRSTTPLVFLAWLMLHVCAVRAKRRTFSEALRTLGVAGAVFLCTIGPVILHNRHDLGIWSISSYQMGGWSLYLSTNPTYLGNWNQEDVDNFEALYRQHPAPPGENAVLYRDRWAAQLAWERLQRYPWHWAGAVLFFKPYCFWGDPSGSFWVNQQFRAGSAAHGLAAFWLVWWHKTALLTAALALRAVGSRPAQPGSALWLYNFYLWFASLSTLFFCVVGTEGRYHNVHLGWICALAAWTWMRRLPPAVGSPP